MRQFFSYQRQDTSECYGRVLFIDKGYEIWYDRDETRQEGGIGYGRFRTQRTPQQNAAQISGNGLFRLSAARGSGDDAVLRHSAPRYQRDRS